MGMVFCRGCGKEIHETAISCPMCGAVQTVTPSAGMALTQYSATDKRILPAFLMCFFLGFLGIHRFYVGKIGTGVAMLLTGGGLFVWQLIDLIILATGSFTDEKGNKLNLWT
jgi:TM2 domain-containing membrane protein YozV